MWFDSLMDDFKKCLLISNHCRGIFIPIFLKLAVNITMGLLVFLGFMGTLTAGIFTSKYEADFFNVFLKMLLPASIFIIILLILYTILWSLIEVGSLGLYKAVLKGHMPTKEHFWSGVKIFLGRIIGGSILFHLVVFISTVVFSVLLILYFVLIGTLTAGWGIIFLFVGLSAFFATWTIAIINDDISIIEGFKASISLTKKHFKPMFLILFIQSMLTKYAVILLGPVGLIFAGWFISGVLATYFKLTLYSTYLRYKED